MNITELTIDKRSIGNKLWLVDVIPSYEYKDNVRTDSISRYRYIIALPEKNLEKISVRIDGNQQIEAPEGYVEVAFQDLQLFLYWTKGGHQLGAKANSISLVNAKA